MRKNLDSRCSALAKAGKPCRAAATAGGLCFFHANPKKASELGRIGGRRKRLSTAENAAPLPELESVTAVRDAVAQLIADVYAGKMNPRIAANLAPLLNLQLRAIETIDLGERISRMEKPLAKLDDKGVGRRNNANGGLQTRPNGTAEDQILS
jgi:hypothetical protein